VQTLTIPSRSKLMLRYLSDVLAVNIYLFSSRSEPIYFGNPSAASSISFFHRVDSFYGISEYLVIVPSAHIHVAKELPPPVNPPAFYSTTPVATFRDAKRRNQKRLRDDVPVDDEACKRLFRQACVEKLEELMQGAIKSATEKKLSKKGDTREQLLSAARDSLKQKYSNYSKLVRGVMDKALEAVKVEFGLSEKYTKVDLQKNLGGNSKNVEVWNEVMISEFTQSWARSLGEDNEGPSQRPDGGPNGGPSGVSGEDEELEGENEEDEEDPTEKIKTCTTTLRTALRPDLQTDYTRILTMLQEGQVNFTNMITELSVLVHKTVLKTASGEIYDGSLYDESLGPQPSKIFRVKAILPIGFEFRGKVDHTINVAPIPHLLQDRIESAIANSHKDDLAQLLSQDHLQFLHTAFLSSFQRERDSINQSIDGPESPDMSNAKHPIWEKAAHAIRTPDSPDPSTSPTG
ncbi:hypothetical protein BGX26_006176, partial [Mortierella sp. AD094]